MADTRESCIPTPNACAIARTREDFPERFIKRPRASLRISKRASDMPFEAYRPNLEAPNWNIPATGGFLGGRHTGCLMALAHIKRRSDPGFHDSHHSPLLWIVISLIERDRQFRESGDAKAMKSFSGQLEGFFGMLQHVFDAFLRGEGPDLSGMADHPMEKILADANRGLGLDHEAYLGWLYGTDGSEKPADKLADQQTQGVAA